MPRLLFPKIMGYSTHQNIQVNVFNKHGFLLIIIKDQGLEKVGFRTRFLMV